MIDGGRTGSSVTFIVEDGVYTGRFASSGDFTRCG